MEEKIKFRCKCGHEWKPRKPLEDRKKPFRCSKCGASGDSIEPVKKDELSLMNGEFVRKRAKLLRLISQDFRKLTNFLPEQFKVGYSGLERSGEVRRGRIGGSLLFMDQCQRNGSGFRIDRIPRGNREGA